jgi:predicted RND superfamily exporter protein
LVGKSLSDGGSVRTEFAILAIIGLFVAFIFFLFLMPAPVYKRDIPMVCSTVEFNPDMTPEARKKCRELRATKY